MSRRAMLVYGTRPEAIKMAPIVLALREAVGFDPCVVVTGQHREMLDQVHEFFGITPDVDLDLMSHGASINAITRRVLRHMEVVLSERRPDVILVQGDTTSAMAASMAGFLAGVPVVHVEAGLRTGDLLSPFPEEANRRLTAVVARQHLAPTVTARANLLSEGLRAQDVIVTGNTVVDALQWAVRQEVSFSDPRVAELTEGDPFVLVTTHRRESWGQPMQSSMSGIGDVAREHPDLQFLLPLHRNPVVRDVVVEALGAAPNVTLTEPLAYPEFAHAMRCSRLVVTDSGGVQEEAPGLGKPVLVLRETTERPEGVHAGTVRLIGTDRDVVRKEVDRLLSDQDAYDEMAHAVNPYGDGRAAERSVASLRHLFGEAPRPEELVLGL